MTTFEKLDPLDNIFNNGANSYHIEQFDNGIRFELRLIHTNSDRCVDHLNLEWGTISLEHIDPVFYNHKVIKSRFNRSDWNEDACPHVLKTIKDRMNENNQQSLIDYVKEHNEFNENYMEVMINHWSSSY